MSASVKIEKTGDCDATIEEILASVKFQNAHGNKLVSYQNLSDRVILTYEEY
jgi:hypothetical protein